MKTIVLFFLLVQLSFAQSPLLTLFDGGVSYEPETLIYQARVEADGGEVIDLDAVNNFYLDAKANNYLDTLICALLYTGGLKKSNDSVFTWYDLTSNENDFVSGLGIPSLLTASFFNATNGIGGNTLPGYFCVLTYNQPTAYYSITKRSGKTGYEYFWGAVGNHAFLQNGTDRGLYLHAGVDFTPALSYTENTFQLFRLIYSGASSSAQINNGIAVVGNAGTTNLSSTTFVLFREQTDTYFKCFVISPRLSTTKDLALKTILNTLYPTY